MGSVEAIVTENFAHIELLEKRDHGGQNVFKWMRPKKIELIASSKIFAQHLLLVPTSNSGRYYTIDGLNLSLTYKLFVNVMTNREEEDVN